MRNNSHPEIKSTGSLEAGVAPVGAVPTFLGTTLEFAQFCNDQFNAETTMKGVQRRLVMMISDWFGLDGAVYLTLEASRVDENFKAGVSRFSFVPAIEERETQAIRAALQVITAGELEVRQGFYVIQVAGTEYLCAQFEESAHQRGVLVWHGSSLLPGTRGALILSDGAPAGDLLEYVVRCAQQSSQWLRRLDQTQALLYQDEVTGLYNYRYLDVALDGEIRRLQRFRSPFSLLFIDLDNFKQVNDQYGHLTGSDVLRQAGEQIKAAVRDVDSVIRYGGDEFVVVLLGANSKQAWMAAERVRSRVGNHRFKAIDSNANINITTSIGVACCPEHGRDKSTIIRLADETMYMAKKNGKNRVVMVQSKEKQPTPTTARGTR